MHRFTYFKENFIFKISFGFDVAGKRSLDRISVDRNCVLSLDQNYVNHLTEFFDTFHLIELFDQLPKNNLHILAVDRKF